MGYLVDTLVFVGARGAAGDNLNVLYMLTGFIAASRMVWRTCYQQLDNATYWTGGRRRAGKSITVMKSS